MEKFIYIVTDANRACLHVGLTENIAHTMMFYQENKKLFFESPQHHFRLVYYERIQGEQNAIQRFKQLSLYTRPQKERLIRALNRDWRDLSSVFCQEPYQPGAKLSPKVPNLTSLRWKGNA